MKRSFAAAVVLCVTGLSSSALAFPTMVRHGYTSCAACHVDPSGGTAITEYGRAQSDLWVRWNWDSSVEEKKAEEREVSSTARFLWGIELPEWLVLSGNLRGGMLATATPTADIHPLVMGTEARAAVLLGPVVASGSLGFGFRRVGPISITRGNGTNALISREHWLGVKFLDDSFMVRAGRLNLPFGLRNVEHYSLVRAATRTDIDTQQQYGGSVSYNGESFRGEVMGIAGNYVVNPDSYRERGYSLFLEYAFTPKATVGVSSLITWAAADLNTTQPTTRHAHGAFGRFGLGESLALLVEADALLNALWSTATVAPGATFAQNGFGFVGFAQLDWELKQGLHLAATLEAQLPSAPAPVGFIGGGWVSAIWYVLPHTELRFDTILRDQPGAFTATFLLQAHVYL